MIGIAIVIVPAHAIIIKFLQRDGTGLAVVKTVPMGHNTRGYYKTAFFG